MAAVKSKRKMLFSGAWGLALVSLTSATCWAEPDSASVTLDTVVVTGQQYGEDRAASPATIWVIDEEQIKKSNAGSVTDLLASSAAGFFSEWTPGQTSINIRGGASDGQGKDFKSQVMVLINGRRAGTANLSKLSPREVKRVEIMRGPASVRYGSQAIGGIINIITKDGRNTEGGEVDARIGSAGLVQTHAEFAKAWGESEAVATYIGGTWGRKHDYDGGKGAGTQVNTQWKRYGGLGDIDWRVNESHDLQLTLRSDGIYDVGFRGSGANRYARDDRFNQSLDLSWNFSPDELPVKWNLHNYLVYDEDYFKWASPKNNTSLDHNKRRLYIMGTKFQPVVKLGDSNELLLGVDLEHSKLSSLRDRRNLNGTPNPTSPQDVNQTEKVMAFYVEDTQRFFDDRLTLRGGLRYTKGTTTVDFTPHMARQVLDSNDYDKTTWSLGANLAATENLSFRLGAATGFRAPTATEMGGEVSFLNNPNKVTYGTKGISPETSLQYEAGLFAHGQGWFADLAVYHNEIKDRIVSRDISATEARYVNNDGKVLISGLELDSRLNVDQLTDLGDWQLSFGLNASYNFQMKDQGRKNRNRNEVDRVYKYQGAIFTQFGQSGETGAPWSIRLTGILRGPVYYDTEEGLYRPQFEPSSDFIHRKAPFMVWNLNGELGLSDSWTVYAGLNNLFNKNQHPLFIAIDDGTQYLSNPNDGGYGTSMPGREFYVGLKYSF